MKSSKMKAVITTKYGSPQVLKYQELEKPTPKANEVLIRIHASSVTAADSMMRRGVPFYGRLFIGLFKPKNPVPGTGFAGKVEEVGEKVLLFRKGDSVFGESVFGPGTNAEYICLAEDGVIVKKPENITYDEAAPVCDGALTSMNFLKILADIKEGQKVLINGASGSLGTAAVQLAKHFGAEVTGVCSTSNIELVKSLGADKVIDYTKADFNRMNQTYDVIYDTVGKSSFSKCKNVLNKKGAYISPVLSLSLLFQMIWTSVAGNKKAKFSATGMLPVPKLQLLLKELKEMLKAGNIKTIIDRRYALKQISEAHRYVDTGRKRGNIVVSM